MYISVYVSIYLSLSLYTYTLLGHFLGSFNSGRFVSILAASRTSVVKLISVGIRVSFGAVAARSITSSLRRS